MMKKIGFYFFSGTGMTQYVVDRLVNEIEKNRVSVTCFKIEELPAQNVNLSEYDGLGIAYPVHSFNAPQIIIDFVKRLPASNGMDTFIINTAGEEHKINYAASDLLIKKLRSKGYRVFYNRLVEMPSNFAIQYDEAKVSGILDKVENDIPDIARDIMEFTPYFMKKGLTARILTVLGRTEWYGAHMVGKFYYVKSGCTRCRKCVEHCPNHNIVMTEKRIHFKWHCSMCMRCIYQCPENAIDVHQPFKFIRFKKWYDPELFRRNKYITQKGNY